MKFLVAVFAVLLVLTASLSSEARPRVSSQNISDLKKLVGLSLLASRAHTKSGLVKIWTDCSKPGDKMKIGSVDIMPDPPVGGQSLSVKANFTLSEQVSTGSEVKVNITVDGSNIVDTTLELCDIASQINLKCPLMPGTHTASISGIDLPSDVKGHLTGTQYLMDQNGMELTCVKLDFNL